MEVVRVKRLIVSILIAVILVCCSGCTTDSNSDAADSLGTALLFAAVAGGLAIMSYEEQYPVTDIARDLAIERCIRDNVNRYIEQSEMTFYGAESEQ